MGGRKKFATSALDPDFTFRAINATLYGRNNNKERQFERLSLSLYVGWTTDGRAAADGPIAKTGQQPHVDRPAQAPRENESREY